MDSDAVQINDSGDALPRKTNYGPFVRVVEPGRHVYRTRIEFNRRLIAICCLAGSILCGRIAIGTLSWAVSTADRVFAGIFLFGGLVTFGIAMVAVLGRANLEITREQVRLWRTGLLYGRKNKRRWKTEEIIGVAISDFPTFHIGGSTALYAVVLRIADGEVVPFGASFDELGQAKAMMLGITLSLSRALTTQANF